MPNISNLYSMPMNNRLLPLLGLHSCCYFCRPISYDHITRLIFCYFCNRKQPASTSDLMECQWCRVSSTKHIPATKAKLWKWADLQTTVNLSQKSQRNHQNLNLTSLQHIQISHDICIVRSGKQTRRSATVEKQRNRASAGHFLLGWPIDHAIHCAMYLRLA